MREVPTQDLWAELRLRRPVSEDALTSRPLVWDGIDTGILMAMDAAGDLHLLVPLQGPVPTAEPSDLVGLRVRRRMFTTGEHLDLVAAPSHEHVFSPVCAEVIEAVHARRREPIAAVAAIIRACQAAWRSSRPQMEKTVQVGLVGELFILLRLMLPALGPSAIHQWSGPHAERHDFVGERLHLEVKTTRRSRAEHEISRLDQLRVPEGRDLLVASVQLEETIGGDVTLATLIDAIVDAVRLEPGLTYEFLSKVQSLGWTDEMRRSGELMRFFVRDASVFEVDAGFPRLPDDFAPPSGVLAVRYTVSLANLPSLTPGEAIALVRAGNPDLVATPA